MASPKVEKVASPPRSRRSRDASADRKPRNRSPPARRSKDRRRSATPEKRSSRHRDRRRTPSRHRSRSLSLKRRERSKDVEKNQGRNSRSRTPQKRSKTDEPDLRDTTPEAKFSKNSHELKERSISRKRTTSTSSNDSEKVAKGSRLSDKPPEKTKQPDKKKNVKPLPVVRLRSSTDEEQSGSDNENFDEEREKEQRILRLLKSDLAAKAREALEKKLPKKSRSPSLLDILKLKTEKISAPRASEQRAIQPDVFDIKVLPLKKQKDVSRSPEVKPPSQADKEKNLFDLKTKSKLPLRRKSVSTSKSKSRSISRGRYRSSSKSSYR